MNTWRIAWLLPIAWFYWQPSLSELSHLFPDTKIFTGLFPGFAKGFEDSVDVEVVGERKIIAVTDSKQSYGDNFTYLSPNIVPRLLRFRPHVIFSSSFGVWTILAVLFKLIGEWKLVIAYEGSSPGVDYRNSAVRLAIRRIMVRMADACISNSEAGQRYLIEVLKANPARVFKQPYEVPDVRSLAAVNPELTVVSQHSQRRFEDLSRPVFIFVGSIVARKGVRCLIEACNILKESGLTDFTVLLVGDGDRAAELQALTQTYDLGHCVEWIGRIDYSDMGTYFHHSDVFVLPTLEDTWGMVVLEAMLLGKAILCSTGAGAAELVVDGQNGYQFLPEQPEKLAKVMKRLIEHPDEIAAMGKSSKQIMAQNSPKVAADFMADIIKTVKKG